VLLATLKLDKKYKFDTIRRGMTLPEQALHHEKNGLNYKNNHYFQMHDLYMDLREPLHLLEARELADRLASLDRIVGVSLYRIMWLDYTY
jgi:hypothetical protein